MIRCLLITILGGWTAAAAEQATVWKRWELSMGGWPDRSCVDVTFSGPAGQKIKAPAFRSGDRTVRARVAFPQSGEWTWEAADTVAAAPTRRGRVCVAGYSGTNPLYRHGFLRVSGNGRYLEHADGTPFLWMGDTVWFGITRATDAEWSEYLDIRSRNRFSVVQVSALGTWPKLLPASVPIPQAFDAAGAPNPAHWDRVDARVREANEKGLVAVIIGFARPPLNADLENVAKPDYARYVAARFFGDHVVLSPNFDRAYQPLFDRVAENLRAHTSIHLITQHPNTQDGQNDLYVPKEYLSFSGLQSGHHEGKLDRAYTAAREWPLRLRSLQPVKPVINIEAMYDGRGNNDGPAWREQDARKLGWISWLSGAMGYTYGSGETARKVPGSAGGMWGFNQTPDAWDYWRKVALWPSVGQMSILRDFFAAVEWWRLQPAPQRVLSKGGTVLDRPVLAVADDGSFAVAYLPDSGSITVDMAAFASPMEALWFNPLTAERAPLPRALPNSGASEFTAPGSRSDWVLLLRATKR
jgi:hypothetical protein